MSKTKTFFTRFVGCLAISLLVAQFLTPNSAYATYSASISRSGDEVTITEDGERPVQPSSRGTLGVGKDEVSVTTDCYAGYDFYVSATESGSTKLTLMNAEDPTASSSYIESSQNDLASTLEKDTWGVGNSNVAFSKINAYSDDVSVWSPFFTADSSATFDVYFGANISTNKAPGIYNGSVLYTVVMNEACSRYALTFDTSTATSSTLDEVRVPFGSDVDLSIYSTKEKIARTGYTLTGWEYTIDDTNYNFTTTDNTNINPENANEIILSPIWTANTYDLEYDANGGSSSLPYYTDLAYGSTTDILSMTITRKGHTFLGWAHQKTATTPDYEAGQTNVPVAELAENNMGGSVVDENGAKITLYAVWRPNSYTIAFDTNGATGEPTTSATSATYDGSVVMPNVGTMEKANYVFAGWSYETDGTAVYAAGEVYDTATLAIATNTTDQDGATITLYAIWSPAPYTLKTVKGDVSAIDTIEPDTGDEGSSIPYGSPVSVSCTAKSGRHCTGWVSSDTTLLPSSSNATYNFNMPAGNVTLMATADLNTYTVKYNANSPTGSYSGSTANTTGVVYGTNTSLATNGYSITGYTFRGWAYSSSASSPDFTGGQTDVSINILAENNAAGSVIDTNGGVINLYAIWRANTYTINYAAGSTGGSCSVSGTSATYDQNVTLASSGCSKSGYYYLRGWSTSSSGGSRTYTLGQTLTTPNFTSTDGGSYTLYPYFVYDPPSYTLSVSNGIIGTSGSTTSGSYTAGSTITITARSPGSYYYFSYWSSSNGGSFASQYSSSTTFTMPSNSVTVTAHFTYSPPAPSTPNCSSTVHPTASSGCKMADGRTWILGNDGNETSWSRMFTDATKQDNHDATVKSGICPSGYSAPKITDYDTLVRAYGGTAYHEYRDGYILKDSSDLYEILDIGSAGYRNYWSSTEAGSSRAYYLFVNGTTRVDTGGRLDTYNSSYILCYKS